MINLKGFFEYLRTIFLTLLFTLIAIIVLLLIIQHQIYEEQLNKNLQDETINYYLIGVLIEKNKYLEKQSPDNYKINLKLGILYQIKKDYKNSELEYKQAIAKAPYNEFKPEYRLALLYLTENHCDEAETVIDKIKEKPDEKLITYKADVYEKLGDKYYNSGDYEDAIEKYENSLFYWKVIKNKKHIDYNENSLASANIYLAEQYLNNLKVDDAITSLKNALLIVDAPIIKYKLALLLMNDNHEQAYNYFEDVFKTAPELINYDTYYKFLSAMIDEENANGNSAVAELYQFKLDKIKEYFKINILSIDDIVLKDLRTKIKSNNWTKKDTIYLEARFENVSKNDINSLFVEIIFKDNNQVIADYTKQIIDLNSPLKPSQISPLISIRVSEPQTNKNNSLKNITAEIYISKTGKSYKLLLKTIEIKQKIKKNPPNKFLKKFGQIFEQITSKLPSFLF